MRLAWTVLDGESGHDAGRRLLRDLYREATGENLPSIQIAHRGKPFLENSLWQFSISHTKKHAFCALSMENVAVDAEEMDRKINLRLADKILSPGERGQYDAAPDKHRALLTFWVLKEAAAKLSGEGLRGYPDHTSFSLADNRVQEIDGCLVAVMTEKSSP